MSRLLPEGFEGLEPFVERWAVAGTAARSAVRGSSTPEERVAFFAAGAPLLGRALDYLDGKPLAQLAGADERLMNLMLALAHVGLAVEIQGPDEAPSAPWRARMRITRAPADFSPAGGAQWPEGR
jgi:hypothetical protein